MKKSNIFSIFRLSNLKRFYLYSVFFCHCRLNISTPFSFFHKDLLITHSIACRYG